MAPKLFETDSDDDDSIRTDYTTEDDPDTEYNIEKILEEDFKTKQYRIKWAGYPITEATWEPRENLPDDDNELFVEWRRHVKAVRDGKEDAFDRAQWEKEWEKHREQQNQRRARRNAKRRKKQLWLRPDSLEEEEEEEEEEARPAPDDEDEESEDEPLANRAANSRPPPQQPVYRKGVAQRVRKRRHDQHSDSSPSEESGEVTSDDSEDSLMKEMSSRKVRTRTAAVKRQRLDEGAIKPYQNPSVVSPRKQRSSPKPAARPAQIEPRRDKQTQQRPPAPMRTLSTQSGTARTSVPSSNAAGTLPARAKKSKNVMSNWGADKQRRKRVPAPETAQRGFLHLRMQNEVHKKARVEAAPDLSALNIIDPKTGKVIGKANKDPALAQEGATTKLLAAAPATSKVAFSNPTSVVAGEIHGAYARRSPPRNVRNPEPVPVPPVLGSRSASITQMDDISERQPSTMTDDISTSAAARGVATCGFWLKGECRHNAQDCRFLHSLKGDATKISGHSAAQLRLPPIDWSYTAGHLLCFFLRTNGKCKMGSACRDSHIDTGYDAPPPGVTVEDARASQVAYQKLSVSSTDSASTALRKDASSITTADDTTTVPISVRESMSRDSQKVRQHPEGTQFPGRLTCHFWRTQNKCTKGNFCAYSHYDTGFDALPPNAPRKNLKQIDASVPNANTEPMGYQRWTPGMDSEITAQPVHRPVFIEPQYANVPGPPPLQIGTPLSSDLVMSPGLMTASPMHTSLSDPRRASTTMHSMWTPHDTSAGLVMKDAILRLHHQGSERPYSVRLKLNVLGERVFARLVGDEPVMRVEHAILTSDVKALLWDDIQHSPNVAAGAVHMDVAPEHEMSGLAEVCKLHDCGLLAAVEGYSANIIIYPSNAEQWKFLEAPGVPSGGGASLKLCVFDGCPDLRERVRSTVTPMRSDRRSAATIVGEALAQLERDRIFPKNVNAVFLMMLPAHAAELEVLKRVFVAEARWKVYHSGTAGAWQYFCQRYQKSGVVLVHPDVPLWQIPKLSELSLTTTMLFFTIGIDLDAAILSDHEAAFQCTRLFPLGAAALLTDELLVNYPEKATEIVQNFLDATSCKPEGAETNKIVARPGIKRFLLKHFIERERSEDRYVRLYGALCDLCPHEDEDLADPPNPLATSHLVSIDPDLLPSFAGLWERDEHAADDLLVEWFAGWAVLNASRIRKFAVTTGTVTGDRGWAQKYQHISVLKPDRMMRSVIKEGKPEKGVRNWTSSKQ